MERQRRAEIQFSLHEGRPRQLGAGMEGGRLPRVTQVLALALSFQDRMASGRARNYEELAQGAGVSAQRLSQVMQLLWLAPAIQQEILYLPVGGGRHPVTESAVRGIAARWWWPEQMKLWSRLKQELRLSVPDLVLGKLRNDQRDDV
jgi:hypothetical protein